MTARTSPADNFPALLRWRSYKRESTYRGRWIGRIGRVAVVQIDEQTFIDPGFAYGICLPRTIDDFGDINASTRTWGRTMKTLEGAKAAAEREVVAWLKRAGVRKDG